MTTRAELLAHLAALADDGQAAPCLTHPEAGWTSDDHDQQRTAAALCGPCPALAPCLAYGDAHPKEWGCYGGRPNVERQEPPRDTERTHP
jgi:hypothetical protein